MKDRARERELHAAAAHFEAQRLDDQSVRWCTFARKQSDALSAEEQQQTRRGRVLPDRTHAGKQPDVGDRVIELQRGGAHFLSPPLKKHVLSAVEGGGQ